MTAERAPVMARLCQHAVMERADGSGHRVRQIVTWVGILAALAVSFFLVGPIFSVVHSVTGGSMAADVAVGVLFVIAPMAAIIGYAYLARRRGWPQSWGWWLLVLYLPAFDLEPFSRFGTNTALQHRLDTQLPGFLVGMLAGFVLLMMLFVVPGLIVTRLRRRRRVGDK